MSEKLKEIASLFFKLGVIAFGGPAAHIAMMQDEVVTKRKWMTDQHFLDLVGATNLIPGPNSTEMALHCGLDRGRWPGLIISGVCFIGPAAVSTGILAWLYVTYQTVPAFNSLLFGIKPAVIAIILSAVMKLGKKALKGWQLGVIGALVIAASLSGINEVVAILAGGILGIFWLMMSDRDRFQPKASWLPWIGLSAPLALQNTPVDFSLLKLFLVFLKVGSVLFGSGYVLIAYLDAELVNTLGWLTKGELLDAIAIGQFTPGPVLSTATFIGYQIGGFWGAVLATLGIFIPSFLFVALLNPLIPKIRSSAIASAFLDAVNIAALGVMIGVTIKLGMDVLVDWRAILILAISLIAVFGFKKVNSMMTVLGGAVLGYLLLLI